MRRATAITLLALLAALAAGGTAARAQAPPGATARCSDGTYSFSQHRSGTCSHHQGVAQWLTAAPAKLTAAVSVGTTVLLQPRTRDSQCRLGVRPDRRCSPGAYSTGLTQRVICSSSFRTTTIRNVPLAEKHAVETAYGLPARSYGSTLEIDHIVSLELGGSNDPANLFPERAPGFHAKDKLENRLHDMVCAGQISLEAAQHQIAANWQALYRRVFGSR